LTRLPIDVGVGPRGSVQPCAVSCILTPSSSSVLSEEIVSTCICTFRLGIVD
jgi:hypothetical protein